MCPQPVSPEQPRLPDSKKKPRRGYLLKRFDVIFEWMSKLITEQAKLDMVQEKEAFLRSRDISVQARIEDVLERAQKTCNDLELLKKSFLEREKSSDAAASIAKAIDPMITEAKNIVIQLSSPPSSGIQENVLSRAVEVVDLYESFSDETKLIRKIIEGGVALTKNIVQKDIEYLLSYRPDRYQHIVLDLESQKKLKKELEKELFPVLTRFEEQCAQVPEFDDLAHFLVWKRDVDAAREALHNKALPIIESVMHRLFEPQLKSGHIQEKSSIVSAAFKEDMKEAVDQLDALLELESELLRLRDDLQNEEFDEHEVSEKKKELTRIKQEIEELRYMESTHLLIQDALEGVFDAIQEIDALFYEHKKEL